MVEKVSKETAQRAISWLRNTNVSPEKIADYLGFHGDNKARFIIFGNKFRKEIWSKLDKEKIK